jgi:hypothetical protein
MTTESPLALLFALALVALLGCRTAAQQASVHIDQASVPAELRADYSTFAVNCSKCHSISRAINAHISDVEHWNRYVARMARTPGSGISPAEAPSILRFLHWHTAQKLAEREEKQ